MMMMMMMMMMMISQYYQTGIFFGLYMRNVSICKKQIYLISFEHNCIHG